MKAGTRRAAFPANPENIWRSAFFFQICENSDLLAGLRAAQALQAFHAFHPKTNYIFRS